MVKRVKFLILLGYYNRPNFVQLALKSLQRQTYDDWEVAVIDDASTISIKTVIDLHLPENKYKIFRSERTEQEKIQIGSEWGQLMNVAMRESRSTYAMMLGDDDFLYYDYLEYLAKFYKENPHIQFSSCGMVTWRKMDGVKFIDAVKNYNELDKVPDGRWSSQLSWKIDPVVQFNANILRAQDRIISNSLKGAHVNHPLVYNGAVGQVMTWWPGSIGSRPGNYMDQPVHAMRNPIDIGEEELAPCLDFMNTDDPCLFPNRYGI